MTDVMDPVFVKPTQRGWDCLGGCLAAAQPKGWTAAEFFVASCAALELDLGCGNSQRGSVPPAVGPQAAAC